MSNPIVEWIPLKPAVRSDAATPLDVLVKITAPSQLNVTRPPLNLGLVIDRSGSMAGGKIEHARQAAIFAVQQLLPSDRVSVTVFDDKVETIVPNTTAEAKSRIIGAIADIRSNGQTALHAGWSESAKQVSSHLVKNGINRVLLLSDGHANVGLTVPDQIATDVNRATHGSVSTTTLGLGNDYNEDLLEAMAKSGDGNYHYVESPNQLPDIFQSELQGLMRTFGNAVLLGVQPRGGVALAEVLNDFDQTPGDLYKLPNLVAGMPVLAVLRLVVPPLASESVLANVQFEWTEPNATAPRTLSATLSLSGVPSAAWDALAANVEVEERVALLLVARYKRKATTCLEAGNAADARAWMNKAKVALASAPNTPEIQAEIKAFAELEAMLETGAEARYLKASKHQAHSRRSSRPYSP